MTNPTDWVTNCKGIMPRRFIRSAKEFIAQKSWTLSSTASGNDIADLLKVKFREEEALFEEFRAFFLSEYQNRTQAVKGAYYINSHTRDMTSQRLRQLITDNPTNEVNRESGLTRVLEEEDHITKFILTIIPERETQFDEATGEFEVRDKGIKVSIKFNYNHNTSILEANTLEYGILIKAIKYLNDTFPFRLKPFSAFINYQDNITEKMIEGILLQLLDPQWLSNTDEMLRIINQNSGPHFYVKELYNKDGEPIKVGEYDLRKCELVQADIRGRGRLPIIRTLENQGVDIVGYDIHLHYKGHQMTIRLKCTSHFSALKINRKNKNEGYQEMLELKNEIETLMRDNFF